MKNVSAFLKRHSALLLLVLVLATVPAGVAFGKYVKSVKVTDGISVTVSVATPADNYTIGKNKMWSALEELGADSTITELKFVGGSDVPDEVDATYGKSIHDTSITPKSGEIYAYRKGNVIYIAPAGGVDKVMYAPKNSAYLFDSRYAGTVVESLTSISFDNLNTSKVTNMSSMFYQCKSLTSLDLRNFDTGNVTDMSYMFYMFNGNTALTKLDLSSFNTSKVTTMMGMFQGCTLLPELDVSNFNTSNVTNMQSMFETCKGLTTLDLSSFNVSPSCTKASMFEKCTALKTIYASQDWAVEGNSTGMNMFKDCTSLVGGKGTVYSDSNTYLTYARIDDPDNKKPGYFTDINAKSTLSANGSINTSGFGIVS